LDGPEFDREKQIGVMLWPQALKKRSGHCTKETYYCLNKKAQLQLKILVPPKGHLISK